MTKRTVCTEQTSEAQVLLGMLLSTSKTLHTTAKVLIDLGSEAAAQQPTEEAPARWVKTGLQLVAADVEIKRLIGEIKEEIHG